MLEDDVIKHFCKWLESNGWEIESVALGRQRGDDIRAKKGNKLILSEAKGSYGNPKNHGVVRSEFDSGQIKDHLGKAIVKVLELRRREPDAKLIIVHPDTPKIFKIVSPVAEELIPVGVSFAFINDCGGVKWAGAPF